MQQSKRFGAILLVLVMLTAFIPAMPTAQAAETSSGWVYNIVSGKAYITNYTGDKTATKVTVPGTLGGATVVSIGNQVFQKRDMLTSITIPDSVTAIGDEAFSGCGVLSSVKIPKKVTTIGRLAFSGCTALVSITIPGSVTYIGNNAFSGTGWYNQQSDGVLYKDNWCLGYKGTEPSGALSLKSGTKRISNYAFSGCSMLTSVKIPDSVTAIGAGSFRNCSMTSVTIGKGVTSIGYEAFFDCTALTSVTIPGSVKSIGEIAFSGCRSMKSVTIADSVTSIGNGAFANCTALTSAKISASIKAISEKTFENCTALKSVTIPGSVTSIGDSAFLGCAALTSIKIPKNVTSVGENAFKHTGWYSQHAKGILYLDDWCVGEKDMYSGDTWTLKSSIKGISDGAFRGSSVKAITIPKNVTIIGKYAFYGCRWLTSANIPNGVKTIREYTFYECPVTSITIPGSVTSIGANAFKSSALTKITVPSGVKSIGEEAFSNCKSLTSATISKGVTSIGASAFSGCNLLKSVTIPSGVTSIAGNTFNGCSAMTSVKIPDTVKSIDGSAFSGCTALKSVSIPGSVKTIGERAFNGCTSLTSATIAEGVKTIGDMAFYGCTALTSITIPGSVTSIGEHTFYYFSNAYHVRLLNLTISCFTGTYAYTYAKNAGFPVSLVEGFTVKFDKNGGTGSMANQAIPMNQSQALTANAFTRKNYTFNGWNTKKDGKGTSHSNKKSVKNLTTDGKTITLYAQWKKVAAPTKAVTSLKLTVPAAKQIKVTYKAVSGAKGYRIEYSTSSKFTASATKTVHTTNLTYTIKSLTAKKKYYVRVTAYKEDSQKNKIYSKKTAAKNITTK